MFGKMFVTPFVNENASTDFLIQKKNYKFLSIFCLSCFIIFMFINYISFSLWMDSDGSTLVNPWIDDIQKRSELQRKNIESLKNAEPLEGAKLSKLDSSLKKLTAFMKKTKSISSKEPATLLIPELSKLNVLKFLDEIATNVCEAKIKSSDVNDLVVFVVHVSSLYPQFPDLLLTELKKQFPTKKSEKIENPVKFKVDLK